MKLKKNIYDLMIGQVGVEEVLQKEAIENLDIIPTSIDLSAAEIELIGVDDKEFIIRNAIAPIKDNYDYIIIDCPPSLSMLTINAMTTADSFWGGSFLGGGFGGLYHLLEIWEKKG